jgi:hypothetical protein
MSELASLRSAHGAFTEFYEQIDETRAILSQIDPTITTQADYATMQGVVLNLFHILAIGVQDLRLTVEQAIESVEAEQKRPSEKNDAPDSSETGD